MQHGKAHSQGAEEAHQENLTIPQAMQHADVRSRATFDKYVQSLHITVKKPGIGSKRHYISWADAERVRQLKEDPLRLEELKHRPDAGPAMSNDTSSV